MGSSNCLDGHILCSKEKKKLIQVWNNLVSFFFLNYSFNSWRIQIMSNLQSALEQDRFLQSVRFMC